MELRGRAKVYVHFVSSLEFDDALCWDVPTCSAARWMGVSSPRKGAYLLMGTENIRDVLGCKVWNRAVVLEFSNVPNRRRIDKVILADLPCGICLAADLDVLQESVACNDLCSSEQRQQKKESCHVVPSVSWAMARDIKRSSFAGADIHVISHFRRHQGKEPNQVSLFYSTSTSFGQVIGIRQLVGNINVAGDWSTGSRRNPRSRPR